MVLSVSQNSARTIQSTGLKDFHCTFIRFFWYRRQRCAPCLRGFGGLVSVVGLAKGQYWSLEGVLLLFRCLGHCKGVQSDTQGVNYVGGTMCGRLSGILDTYYRLCDAANRKTPSSFELRAT